MKIGIYTIHASHNVGAMLQAFALSQKLTSLGAEVEIVNLYSIAEENQNHHKTKGSLIHDILRSIYMFIHPSIKTMEYNFDTFHKRFPLSKRYYSQEEYINEPSNYDIHLIGSDQVWNLQKGYNFSRFYFLDYLPKSSIKMSYGASFGTTTDTKEENIAGNALKSFKSISVREDSAVDFVKKISGKNSEHVVDPTLLLSSTEWDEYIESEPIIKNKYIFFYGVNNDESTWKIICEAKKKLGIPVVGYPGPLRPQYKFDKFILDGGPLQFINLIKNAELVITSSFHGLAFSVNYGKKFILIKYGSRMERMDSLIRLLDANSFIASNLDEATKILNSNFDNKFIQEKLKYAREQSIKWIKNNIID